MLGGHLTRFSVSDDSTPESTPDAEVQAFFSALRDGGESRVGEVIDGRYEIVGELGRGGMGIVYRARQRVIDREVALKLLHPRRAAERDALQRFRREMASMAQLEHPHVVRLYDVGATERGELFMAMELLEGRTLAEVLADEGRLEPARVAHIGRQVARALSAAHARGIVHRDLTPRNIVLRDLPDAPDSVTVLDFGLAALPASEDTQPATPPDESGLRRRFKKLTEAGAILGTPRYFSPEQAQGAQVGPQADLYTLGVVLFEALVGRPPFQSANAARLAYAHVHEEPPRPSTLYPEAPAWLESTVLKLLEKRPKDRPKGADAVVELLSPRREGAARPGKLRRWVALAAAAGAVVGGIAVIVALSLGGQGPGSGTPPPALIRAQASTEPVIEGRTDDQAEPVPEAEEEARPEPKPETPDPKERPVVQDPKGLVLSQVVVARDRDHREPVGVADRFDDGVGSLLCHLTVDNKEGRKRRRLTAIWYHGGREVSRTDLNVGRSPAWRTWAGKKIEPGEDVGAWRCEIENEVGMVLGRQGFVVEPATAR